MFFQEIQIISCVIVCTLSILQIRLLKKLKIQIILSNKESSEVSNKKKLAQPNFFDPLEIKLMNTLVLKHGTDGISVAELNEILNLSKLSSVNQRLRRHIVLKELNLKLFLFTSIRESISRIPSKTDKRLIFYNFVTEISDTDLIIKIINKQF
jgi:hypothetical protein